ncbi:MAG: Gfo/Idh/MocA family protein [Gammaproteobacteria bacterium]
MRVLVVGLGIQGQKRKDHLGDDFIAAVDPINKKAQYKDIKKVPIDIFDAAMVCVPDDQKNKIIEYLISKKKHILVEKPFFLDPKKIDDNLVFYTAYNHRFEPYIQYAKQKIDSGILGQIYWCRIFYGNGTAALVKSSLWRDQKTGVVMDLGSHILDIVHYLFNSYFLNFEITSLNRFENKAPDHVVFINKKTRPNFYLEASLLSWKNTFTVDIIGEQGSLHIDSLCKWGGSTFTYRKRKMPSGIPYEESIYTNQPDPTWEKEYQYFKSLCLLKQNYDFKKDLWIHRTLENLCL